MSTEVFDVAVIGGGIVGCAIARELSGCDLRVTLIEARNDIGDGTSKASTAILHTGFDATPGTIESRLVRRGFAWWSDYAARTGVAVERTGALLVAWDDEQLEALPALAAKAVNNGYTATRIVGADAVYDTVPALGPGALGGLEVPDESVICSWSAAIALATDAVNRGATLLRNSRVEAVTVGATETVLHTTGGEVRARWVVNAAGLGGDTVDAMFGHARFHLHPRKGELIVFDKLARALVPVIVLPVPSKLGKGVLVSPTIYGNVMLGPTAEDLEDRTDTATSEAGFAFLRAKAAQLMPQLLDEEVTAAYAGLRAAHDQSDFFLDADAGQRYVVASCIRSTGITASPAIAEEVRDLLISAGMACESRQGLPEPPQMPNLGEVGPRPFAQADRIADDPAYGEIICFCERVTAGEIRDALASRVPAHDLAGLRRRTRAQTGRCQGFYCAANIRSVLDAAGGK